MRPWFTRGRLLSALLVVGLTAGLLPGAAATARAPAFRIGWAPCATAPAVQCGTLMVPVDWAAPGGPRVPISVARRPADQPATKIGTLFYNPGGPGDGGAEYVMAAERFFSATVRARFDLVALDPRGMGTSVHVQCGLNPIVAETTLFPRTEQQFDQLRRHNRAVGLSCLEHTGALLKHMDTVTVARDHEALRLALGVGQVNWLGISYGTQVAANYAELFPRQTRAMVLDAALEHSKPEGVQVADEIVSQENSFNRFTRWCDTAPSCVLRGQDVGAVFDRLVAGADRRPLAVPGALRPVTGEDIRMGTIGRLTFKEPSIYGPDVSWAGLSRALAAAVAGDAEAFAVAPTADVPQESLLNILGNACGDYVPQIDSWAEMQQRIELGRQLAPHLKGASETWRANFCIGWPVRAANPPRTLDVRGVPALMVHAVHDSSDPYVWAHSLAAQIEGIDLLTRTGDGHTSVYTSPCARTAIDEYLVRPVAPAVRVCAG
ncbi:alpha/beta fold hydrolase [Actinoplanes sp. NPDC048791]|uniref:alpha/beta fold hydrolase n=1 Tax=Actinoplanes sp. NPDC048791 TaxID=3154623 RepID=UPI0033CE846E